MQNKQMKMDMQILYNSNSRPTDPLRHQQKYGTERARPQLNWRLRQTAFVWALLFEHTDLIFFHVDIDLM